MSFFSYVMGALILILVLLRQVRARPVRRVFQPRLPLVIGIIGLFEMFSYAGDHHVASSAWLWVLGTLVVGAIGLGVLRGLSMKVWSGNGWVVRQGTANHDGALARVPAGTFRRRHRTEPCGGGRARGREASSSTWA